MDNIISIILKDQNKLKEQTEKNTNSIKEYLTKEKILEEGIFNNFERLEKKLKRIKTKIKKLEFIITFLFITNLTTIYLLWR